MSHSPHDAGYIRQRLEVHGVAKGLRQDSVVLVGERENKGELMTDEKVIENLKDLAREIVNWNPNTDWGQGYQEAMKHVLERLEGK